MNSTWQIGAGTTGSWSDGANWSSGFPGAAADTLRWNQNGSILNVDYNGGNPTLGYIYPNGGQNLTFTNGVITLDDGAGNGWISPAGYTLTFNSVLTSPGAVHFNPDSWGQSGGTVILYKTNNWAGTTYLARNITLRLGTDNALPTGTVVQLAGTAAAGFTTLDLNGHNQTLGGLESPGITLPDNNQVVNSGAPAVLTINSTTNHVYKGRLSGPITIIKQGTGTQTLTDVNTFSGTLGVSNGTLRLVNGGTSNTPPPGCALWLDATCGVMTNSSGNVTNWVDQSGHARNATNYVGSGPTVTADINGQPTLRFTRASSQYLSCGISSATNLSIFIVHTDWSINSGQTYIGTDGAWRNDGSYGKSLHLIQSYEAPRRLNYAVFNASVWGNNSGIANVAILDEIIDNNGACNLYITGGANGTGTQATLKNLQSFRIGSWDNDATRYLDSSIGEIMIYTNALNETDRTAVEYYLINKWCGPQAMPAGCALWLDATRGVMTNSSGNVTNWVDQSGNARNATNYVGSGPTVTSDINGLKTLRFTRASSQYLSCGIGAMTNLSIFIVHSDWSISGGQTYIGTSGAWRNDGTYGNSVHFIQSGQVPRRFNYAVYNADGLGTTTISTTTTLLDELIDSNGAYSLFLNCTANGSGTQASLKNLQSFRIGSWDSDAARYLDSSIGEILIYTNALSASARGTVEQYLWNKWTSSASTSNTWRIAAGTVLDLGGTAQTVATLAGGGLITNCTLLTVTNALSFSNAIPETLILSSNLTLTAGTTLRYDFNSHTSDTIRVNGTLTLPGANNIILSSTDGALHPVRIPLLTCDSLVGVGNLSSWTVTGADSASYYHTLSADAHTVYVTIIAIGTTFIFF